PNSSVPSRWAGESGGRSRFGVSTASGSGRGRYGAAAASPTTRRMVSAAAAASRLWTSTRAARRPASLIADPRIEVRVEHVDGEVDHDERQRDDEHRALHQRDVAGEDALHDEAAQAGPGEHRFGQDGAAEQI